MTNTLFTNKSVSSKRGILFKSLIILCFLYITFYSYKNLLIYKVILSANDSDITSMFMSHHYFLINENNRNITSLYYRHVTSVRNSSYPFISGDTFRALADYIFDETREDDLKSVKHGDIVFTNAYRLDKFFGQPYASINNSFVLITHNSDLSAPVQHKTKLDDKKIIAWYASNPDLKNHAKLFPIPIGLANVRWPTGNLNLLTYAFQNHRKPWLKRTTLLYVNFNTKTNPKERQAALSQAKNLTKVHIITKKISFDTYLEQIGNAKFVLSPPGNGLDCHRTWEALMMGAMPITLSSALDPLFNNIPAVIIKDWSNLTENFLLSYNFPSSNNLIPVVLYARYWRSRLLRHRHRYM